MNPVGLFIAAAGVFALCGATFDWDWFMNSRKARLWVAMIGRGGARVVYALLGTTLIITGALLSLGVLEQTH